MMIIFFMLAIWKRRGVDNIAKAICNIRTGAERRNLFLVGKMQEED